MEGGAVDREADVSGGMGYRGGRGCGLRDGMGSVREMVEGESGSELVGGGGV